VLLGLGEGTFDAECRFSVGFYPRPIVAGDFNRDGALDLAVGNSNSREVGILLNDTR